MTTQLTAEDLSEIFTKGIASDLEKMLKKQLHEKLDHIIDDFAVELAKNMAVNVKSARYLDFSASDHKIVFNTNIDRKRTSMVEMLSQVTKVE